MIETKEYAEKCDVPVMSGLTATYSQENENDKDFEDKLKVSIYSAGGGFYFVMETERWAFDDIDSLIEVLNDFKTKANI